jgi:membrane fusion protein (multidrug efflux system)
MGLETVAASWWNKTGGRAAPGRWPELAAAALAVVLAGSGTAQAQPAAATAVLVAKASPREMQQQIEYIGRVVAIDKVDVRARVSGFLLSREYKEGQEVKKGDLLFVIDPSQFQATVDEKRASLAGAEAAALNAAQELDRIKELQQKDFGTRQRLDQRTAEDAKAKADVLQAKAAVTLAEIDLGYTRITSPIDGRAGAAASTPGNLVGPDSGVLTTIVSQDPIYVTFPVSQRELLALRQRSTDPTKIVMRVRMVDGSVYKQEGHLAFTDVQFSQQTDSLTVRATFPNPDRLLVDGQSVRVIVATEAPQRLLSVPQEAVQNDQAGTFVLVVGADSKVEVKRVQTGISREGAVAVTSGLQEGERVIVQGIQKVRPGMTVAASEAPVATGARR